MLHIIDHFPPGPRPERLPLCELPTIHPTAEIHHCQVGSWTEFGPHTIMYTSTFDDYSHTDDSVTIMYAHIGKFSAISSHVRINPANHPMERVTQHHCTYRGARYGFDGTDEGTFFARRRATPCTVGHDVWIGYAAAVMPGVTIGTGAVVGAGAVVTRDVAPYTIVAGVPARPLRKRFEEDTIARLLATAWWDWDRPTLEARFKDLLDVPTFLAKYGP